MLCIILIYYSLASDSLQFVIYRRDETRRRLAFQIRIPNIPHKECSIRAEADWKINCSWLPCPVPSTSPLAHLHRVWGGKAKEEACGRCVPRCSSDTALPFIQHVVLIRKVGVEEQPSVNGTNRIQWSINIAHLFIQSCVCPHILRDAWTSSVSAVVFRLCQRSDELKSGELSERKLNRKNVQRFVIEKLPLKSDLKIASYISVFILKRSFPTLINCGKWSHVWCSVGRFSAGHLIGCLHGCTVTNKGCLNCASILLFHHKHAVGGMEGAHIQTDTR